MRISYRAALAGFVPLLAAGCYSEQPPTEITCNIVEPEASPTPPAPEVVNEPDEGAGLTVSSVVVNFGEAEPGTKVLKDFSLSNESDEVITIYSMELDGDDVFSISPEINSTFELGPGQFMIFSVGFAPPWDIVAAGVIRITSDDPAAEEIDVALQGECHTPLAEIFPPVQAFPGVLVGCPTEHTVTIMNSGSEDLEIRALGLEDPDNPDFTFEYPGELPLILPPGQGIDALLTYTPSDTQEDINAIRMVSNDPIGTERFIDVQGWGREPTEVDQTYYAGSMREMDVLVVVDNSPSMCDEQELLRNNLLDFMDIVDQQGVPYHIGVVDVEDLFLEGNPIYVTPDTEDRDEAFFENAFVGCDGWQWTERGLGISTRAMYFQKYIADNGFYRQDAGLRILYISDENDQSVYSVTAYVELLRALKDNPDDVVLTAIAGDPETGCSAGDSLAGPGDRYYEAAEMTGGGFESICEPNFIDVVTQMAWDAVVEYRDTFPLQSRPVVDSIVVTVDGEAIPQDTDDGWSYDDETQVIVLHGDAIPTDYMAEVNIHYMENAFCRAELDPAGSQGDTGSSDL